MEVVIVPSHLELARYYREAWSHKPAWQRL